MRGRHAAAKALPAVHEKAVTCATDRRARSCATVAGAPSSTAEKAPPRLMLYAGKGM